MEKDKVSQTKQEVLILIANRILPRTVENEDVQGVTLTEGDFKNQDIELGQAFYELTQLDKKNWIELDDSMEDFVDRGSVSFLAPYFLKDKVYSENSSNPSSIENLKFNTDKSVLEIGDNTVEISKTSQITNSHHLLDYLFNQKSLGEVVDFSDIYKKKSLEGSDGEFDAAVIYRACDDIQEKVEKATGIEDFLEYTYSEKGWVQINSNYIPENY